MLLCQSTLKKTRFCMVYLQLVFIYKPLKLKLMFSTQPKKDFFYIYSVIFYWIKFFQRANSMKVLMNRPILNPKIKHWRVWLIVLPFFKFCQNVKMYLRAQISCIYFLALFKNCRWVKAALNKISYLSCLLFSTILV